MLGKDRLMPRVGVLPFPNITSAYICISGRKTDGGNGCEPLVSFISVYGDTLTEWEPVCGPIQINYKRNKDAQDAKEHWIWPFASKNGLNFSQLAVKREGLPQKFIEGDYEGIYRVLAEWAKSHAEDKDND